MTPLIETLQTFGLALPRDLRTAKEAHGNEY
jgi:hypothetical protein